MFLWFVLASVAGAAPTSRLLDALPTRFEANRGQWPSTVKFRASAERYSLTMDEQGATLYLASKHRAVRFTSGRSGSLTGLDPLRARANYMTGNDKDRWRFGVPMYNKVRYQGVYPGVDLDYYGTSGKLEYDYRVRPGADPAAIRMSVQGADRMSIDATGDLIVEVAGERVVQKRPVVYQLAADGKRQVVAANYRMASDHSVGFRLGAYDRSRELVIDPVVLYSTLVGGEYNDAVTGITVDSKGFLYFAGYLSANGPTATDGSYQTLNAGLLDIVVAKIDPNQGGSDSIVAMTFLGGTGNDVPKSLAVDAQGNMYLTGTTDSLDFPTAQPLQTDNAGGIDAFFVMIDPTIQGSAALYVSTYLGGTDTDSGNVIRLDGAGNVYIFGTTKSADFPITTATAGQTLRWGAQNAFLTKITPGYTSPVYSTYFGGDVTDDGRAMTVTANGIVYLAGSTSSDQLPPVGDAYKTTRDLLDIFIAKVDPSKTGSDTILYTTFFGGTGLEEVRGMEFDAKGRLVLTGYTTSSDFPVTPGAFQTTLNGPANAFVSVVDPNAPKSGFLVYSTLLGGSGGEVGYAVATNAAGAIYVTGYSMSADFPVTSDAFVPGTTQAILAFVTKLVPSASTKAGQLAYSTCLGTDGINVGLALATSANGGIYLGGYTSPGHIPLNGRTFQPVFNGGTQDGFVMVITP